MTRRWQREMDNATATEKAPPKLCGFCGTRPATRPLDGFSGYCSRACLADALGETDSDVRD